MSTSK